MAFRFTPPEGLVWPLDPAVPQTYREIKKYVLEAIADLVTDPQWAHKLSDNARDLLIEDFLAYDRLPFESDYTDRVAFALQDLHITGEPSRQLTNRWFRQIRVRLY